ncbi:MAG: L,D-transpeptidase ErfK/SrfK [Solirubrobacteraceae bacterium]|nr:L,D-transpeptidase ErfK/SrfK [Solirubrobacteraceae bacterium]
MQRATFIALGATAAVVLVFVLAILVIDGTRDDAIADGVRIGSVDVGGLHRDEARALVERKLGPAVGKRIAVVFGGQRFVLRPEIAKARLDAGASVDAALDRNGSNPFSRVLGGGGGSGTVTPRVSFARPAVEGFASRVAKRVDRPARDADIDWRNGKLDRTRARAGVTVLDAQLRARLAARIANPGPKPRVEVPVKVTERPDRTFEDIAKRYPTVIAVDRDGKMLRLYKNLKLAHKYEIAVGQAGLETSAGRYKIQEKIVDPDWHVPKSAWAGDLAGRTIPAGDPQNPLEARYMGFHDGEGIHGTAELSSLGSAASHGCIRMAVPDVKQLYRAVKVGTPVFVQ